MKTYEGIQLTSTCKHVKMAHSRFFETNEGIDFFEKLIECDKKKLSKEQFRTISSLNSVANANYQICNGGLYQYFDYLAKRITNDYLFNASVIPCQQTAINLSSRDNKYSVTPPFPLSLLPIKGWRHAKSRQKTKGHAGIQCTARQRP